MWFLNQDEISKIYIIRYHIVKNYMIIIYSLKMYQDTSGGRDKYIINAKLFWHNMDSALFWHIFKGIMLFALI